MEKRRIRWGIMGTGWIAERFANALNHLEDAELYAIGSRNIVTGENFRQRFGAEKAYGSYVEMVSDPLVDVVYVATPHVFHKENSVLALENGRAVLCEKAFTVNAAEARAIKKASDENGVFCMEAYWPRFQPLNRELKRLVTEEKVIGDIRMMDVEFMKVEDWPDEHRIYNPALAGGTVLDLGIYTLSYTAYFMGLDITGINAAGTIGKGGVDDQCAFLLQYGNGSVSRQAAALQTKGNEKATIFGTKGRIDIPVFYRPEKAYITDYETGNVTELSADPFICNGYEYEAIEVMNCLREGKKESDIMPLTETVRLMEILDECRKQIGMVYPFE